MPHNCHHDAIARRRGYKGRKGRGVVIFALCNGFKCCLVMMVMVVVVVVVVVVRQRGHPPPDLTK